MEFTEDCLNEVEGLINLVKCPGELIWFIVVHHAPDLFEHLWNLIIKVKRLFRFVGCILELKAKSLPFRGINFLIFSLVCIIGSSKVAISPVHAVAKVTRVGLELTQRHKSVSITVKLDVFSFALFSWSGFWWRWFVGRILELDAKGLPFRSGKGLISTLMVIKGSLEVLFCETSAVTNFNGECFEFIVRGHTIWIAIKWGKLCIAPFFWCWWSWFWFVISILKPQAELCPFTTL